MWSIAEYEKNIFLHMIISYETSCTNLLSEYTCIKIMGQNSSQHDSYLLFLQQDTLLFFSNLVLAVGTIMI